MFDRMGDVSIGLVFGIVLMFLFNSLWGLGVGVMLGLFFLVKPPYQKIYTANTLNRGARLGFSYVYWRKTLT